jgi:hypothetical protein
MKENVFIDTNRLYPHIGFHQTLRLNEHITISKSKYMIVLPENLLRERSRCE